MNFLRRLYVFLLSLLLIIVVTILLLAPGSVSSWMGSIAELSPILRVVGAVVINALLVVLAFLQIRPGKPTTTGLMMRGAGAITEVSVESARDRILKAVSDVPDVVSAEAMVKPIRGRADVELEVEVLGDDLRLPQKQQEINRALKQVINKQLGLQMAGRPRVHIRLYGQKAVKPSPLPTPVISPPPTVEPVVERKPEVTPPIATQQLPPVEPSPRESKVTAPLSPEKSEPEEKSATGFIADLLGWSDEPEPPPTVGSLVKDAPSVVEEKPQSSLPGVWRRVPDQDKLSDIPPDSLSVDSALPHEIEDDDFATIKFDMEKELAASPIDEWVEPTDLSSQDSLSVDDKGQSSETEPEDERDAPSSL